MHGKDIQKIIAKYYDDLNQFYDNKNVQIIVDSIQYKISDLLLLANNTPISEKIDELSMGKKDEDDDIIDTTHKEEENEQKKTTIRPKRLGAARKTVTIRSPEPPSNQSSNSNLQFRLKSPNSYNSHRIILNRNIWSSQSSSPIEMSRSNKLML